jgi:hypothetical protein
MDDLGETIFLECGEYWTGARLHGQGQAQSLRDEESGGRMRMDSYSIVSIVRVLKFGKGFGQENVIY